MSWKPSIPFFNLLLVFLLTADLGSNILVDANAIDCNVSWTPGGPSQISGEGFKPYSCSPGPVTYLCNQCGRADKQPPSAFDCVTQEGKVVNKGGIWTCDLLFSPLSEPRKDGRNFNCNQSATVDLYYCRSRGRPQQCPQGHCCVAGDIKCRF